MTSEQLLKDSLKQLGFPCSKAQINAFMSVLFELKKWNRAYNLTAIKNDKDIIIKHFLDSALYLKAVPKKAGEIADIGAGAGFPGIPIRIIRPEIHMTLIESSGKKTAFLRHIVRLLKLDNVNIICKRLEDLGKDHEQAYDVIVSRATFKARDFIKKACPYLKKNGRLVLSKGPGVSEEIKGIKDNMIEILKIPPGGYAFIPAERNLVILKCNPR